MMHKIPNGIQNNHIPILTKIAILYSLLCLIFLLGTPTQVLAQENSLPQLNYFSISPMEVDVTMHEATIEVSISISDTSSELTYFHVSFASPSRSQHLSINKTLNDSQYTGIDTLVVPMYMESGIWSLEGVGISYNRGNTNLYSEYFPEDLDSLGFSYTFNVIANEDTTPPELLYFDITPRSIDAVEGFGNDTVRVPISVVDGESGVSEISAIYTTPSGNIGIVETPNLIIGSTSYTDTAVIRLSDGHPTGSMVFNSIRIRDVVGNERVYHSAELLDLGFPVSFTVGYAPPVYHVATDGDDDAGNGSPEAPFATIQRGIDAANSGDAVMVASGTYTGYGNKQLLFQTPWSLKRIVLRSQAGPDSTIIDCENDGYGFYLNESQGGEGHDNRTVIKGFSVINGRDDSGGGMHFSGSTTSPLIINCIIKNCFTEAPGLGPGGSGGGIYGSSGASPTFINCIISGNTATWGGGVDMHGGTPLFIQCLITNNTAGNMGGGLHFFQGSEPTLINCTIANNTSPIGAGIYGGGYSNKSLVTLKNSIVWNNSPSQISSDSTIISFSNIEGGQLNIHGGVNWQSDNLEEDPQFIDADTGDFRLATSSTSINSGNPNSLFNDPDGSRNDLGYTGGGFLTPSYTNYDFGQNGLSAAGLDYQDITWELYNGGPEAIVISAASFSSDNFSVIEPHFPITLSAYSRLSFVIQFHPQTLGLLEDIMTLEIPDQGVHSIIFRGEGVSASTLYGNLSGLLSRSGSPYLVLDDIAVAENDSLIIEPGVELRFSSRTKFAIYGHLSALGTEQDSIRFTRHEATDVGKWSGIRFRGSQGYPELAYCIIEFASKKNVSGYRQDVWGGGLYIGSTKLRISHSRVTQNDARYGGGIAIHEGNQQTIIQNSHISQNDGDLGGGLYAFGASPVLMANSFIHNSASSGAGIFLDQSSADIQESRFQSNHGDTGGAIYIDDEYSESVQSINVQTCLITKNTGRSKGSAIYYVGDQSSLSIINCTIADNYLFRPQEGGQIDLSRGSETLLINSILANSVSAKLSADEAFSGNITIAYSLVEGGQTDLLIDSNFVNWFGGNLDSIPGFANISQGLYMLESGSPAIDAGAPFFIWGSDTILNLSTEAYQGAAPDMGAYETISTSVYPGDSDNNGIVDALDILPIGVYFQQVGPPRNPMSMLWEANPTTEWLIPEMTYADANGDGKIDEMDVIAIGVNWSNTHANSSLNYAINPADKLYLDKHTDALLNLYHSLSDDGIAMMEMKSLLRQVLDIHKPLEYALNQNFPNPFNPTTNIQYEIPISSNVVLHIYDIKGALVQTMIEEPQMAGQYKLSWDGTDARGLGLSSGLYFARLEAGIFSKTIKMMLIK